jgi:hypothetical protein
MTEYKTISYQCNFCMTFTQEPVRWFRVTSLRRIGGTQKPSTCVEGDTHACENCGHEIHKILDILGIPHEFEAVAKEREPFLWGRIFVA